MDGCSLISSLPSADLLYKEFYGVYPCLIGKGIESSNRDQQPLAWDEGQMNDEQAWLPFSNVMPQSVDTVAVNSINPLITLRNPSAPHGIFRRPDELANLDSNFWDLSDSNNSEAREDNPQASPVPKVEESCYWEIPHNPLYDDGSSYGVHKEEHDIEAEVGLGVGTADDAAGEVELDGGEDEAEEQEDDQPDNDAKDTKDAAIKSERSREATSPTSPKRISGNNPYGSRGTFSCAWCRRRKGRVSHFGFLPLMVVQL
jgi:hypothetical protein